MKCLAFSSYPTLSEPNDLSIEPSVVEETLLGTTSLLLRLLLFGNFWGLIANLSGVSESTV